MIKITTNRFYNWVILYAGSTKGKHHGEVPHEKSWRDHALVFFRNKLYDTSYGDRNEYLIDDPDSAKKVAKRFEKYCRFEYEDKNGGKPPPKYEFIIGSEKWFDGASAENNWITITSVSDP
jgi:hypothetical protein